MKNLDIRAEIKGAGLHYWQVAERYGCACTTFSVKLRHELPDAEKGKIRAIIAQMKEENAQ